MSHDSFGTLALDVDIVMQAKIIFKWCRAFLHILIFFITFIACSLRGGCHFQSDAHRSERNSLSAVCTCSQVRVYGKLQLQILFNKIRQLDRFMPRVSCTRYLFLTVDAIITMFVQFLLNLFCFVTFIYSFFP